MVAGRIRKAGAVLIGWGSSRYTLILHGALGARPVSLLSGLGWVSVRLGVRMVWTSGHVLKTQ